MIRYRRNPFGRWIVATYALLVAPSAFAQALTLDPPAIDLVTAVDVRDPSSATTSLELSHAGEGVVTVEGLAIVDSGVVGASADWTFLLDGACTELPCALSSGQVLEAELTFNPSAFSLRPARMIVTYRDQNLQQALVDLLGRGSGATVELIGRDSPIDFGVVPIMTPSMVELALINRGTRPATAMLDIDPQGPYLVASSVVVAPGEVSTVTVTCASNPPGMTGKTSSVLTIDASSEAASEPISLTLICDVRDAGFFAAPSAIRWGEVRTGSGPQTIVIELADIAAGGPFPLTGAALFPGDPSLMLGPISAMQTPASLMLTLTPTTESEVTSAITVTPGAGATSIEIPVTADVVTAEVSSPDSTLLGTFCVNQPTTPSTVTLTSTGSATVTLAEAPTLYTTPSPFTLDLLAPTIYPALLRAGDHATVLLTPASSSQPGMVSDMLTWTTELGPTMTTVRVAYLDEGGAIAPAILQFGDAPIRLVTANAQQVTLQNCGTTGLELDPPSVPPPFALEGQFPTLLGAGDRATFQIAFRPTQVGRFERELIVRSVAGDMFRVVLIGVGITNNPGDQEPPGGHATGSFYACSGCGGQGPTGSWPIVIMIAIWALCRARRGRCIVTDRRRTGSS